MKQMEGVWTLCVTAQGWFQEGGIGVNCQGLGNTWDL